jgi:hypothetical protein
MDSSFKIVCAIQLLYPFTYGRLHRWRHLFRTIFVIHRYPAWNYRYPAWTYRYPALYCRYPKIFRRRKIDRYCHGSPQAQNRCERRDSFPLKEWIPAAH